MRMKDIFGAKAGQKVTEQYLLKVLITSVCGILLCMGCLAGTTWAWFTTGIENADNIIHIEKEPPEVSVTANGSSLGEAQHTLPAGEHTLDVVHTREADDVQQKSKLYVTFLTNETVQGYVILNAENQYMDSIQILAAQECAISWTVSWFTPEGADPLDNKTIDLMSEPEETEPTEETTQPTEAETEPTEATTQPTEAETEPTEATTQPTEAETEPTEETTQPTEAETEPTEATTQPTEADQ